MTGHAFVAPGLRELVEHSEELLSPDLHRDEWCLGLEDGDPLVHHLRGRCVLAGAELRRASVNVACGASAAVVAIQARMAVGRRDRRLAERKLVERFARLPEVCPMGVDPSAWRHLAELHDVGLAEEQREQARAALVDLRAADSNGFKRLMRAAAEHDQQVERLVPRAIVTEDTLVFAAAARELWRRFLGREQAFPALPTHVAAFALSVAFSPLEAGALLAALDLASIAPSADLVEEPVRSTLRRAVDRSLRFWAERAGGSRGEGAVLAGEFIAAAGELVVAEQRAEVERPERAKARVRDRRRPPQVASVTESVEVGASTSIQGESEEEGAVQIRPQPDQGLVVLHFEQPDSLSEVEAEPHPPNGED